MNQNFDDKNFVKIIAQIAHQHVWNKKTMRPHMIDGSQAQFNNTQRPARNPEIAQNPSTNIRSPNSVAPPPPVVSNRFGFEDADDEATNAQSVLVCLSF